MKEPVSIITSSDEYTDRYEGEFKNYHQLHIFSAIEIYSTYYDPKHLTIEQVKAVADNMLTTIRRRSSRKGDITMFEKDGKFLIAEHHELIESAEMLVYNGEDMMYDYLDDGDDFIDFLGETKADVFIRKALISVGAEDLYEVIEPHVQQLCREQEQSISQCEELRVLDKTDPHIRVEIYRIEKNYVPVKIQEFFCHSHESFCLLPEHQFVNHLDKRTIYILKDMVTNKTIDGTLDEAIESIKYQKWRRSNPLFFDPNDLMRMELDNDDPDFLSHKAHVKNDDRYEEGDNEYSPH